MILFKRLIPKGTDGVSGAQPRGPKCLESKQLGWVLISTCCPRALVFVLTPFACYFYCV